MELCTKEAPDAGIEPAANALKVQRSTELFFFFFISTGAPVSCCVVIYSGAGALFVYRMRQRWLSLPRRVAGLLMRLASKEWGG